MESKVLIKRAIALREETKAVACLVKDALKARVDDLTPVVEAFQAIQEHLGDLEGILNERVGYDVRIHKIIAFIKKNDVLNAVKLFVDTKDLFKKYEPARVGYPRNNMIYLRDKLEKKCRSHPVITTGFSPQEEEVYNELCDPKTVFITGGAVGADRLWAEAALEAGCDVRIVSFKDHVRSVPDGCSVEELTPEELKDCAASLKKITGRNVPTDERARSLVSRNYGIVADAEAVYAVGKVTDGIVEGGTYWGCAAARRLFLFDQNTNTWVGEGPQDPREFKRVAAIGSREITPQGVEALKSVFKRARAET